MRCPRNGFALQCRATVNTPSSPTFPVARWLALVWLGVSFPIYYVWWGPQNFLYFCHIGVFLATLGVWRGSPLLISAAAVCALAVNVVWCSDVAWRLLTGAHLLGGTEFMFDAQYPVALRMMSLFHVFSPPVLIWALRHTGYDPRGLWFQSGLAVSVMIASRLVRPDLNINFAHADPLFKTQWGPAPLHVAAMIVGLIVVIYLPTHWALKRWMPPAKQS